MSTGVATSPPDAAESTDQRLPLAELFRDLRTSPTGLAGRVGRRRAAAAAGAGEADRP